MAEGSKNRRYADEAVKWVGIGAGAALGSAALAAAVLYATRAKARPKEPAVKLPEGNVPVAPEVTPPRRVVEAED